MEQSSDRLYTGPLSQAAQRVMAALRAQDPDKAKWNQHPSTNHRQIVQRCNNSQREFWALSSRSQVEGEGIDTHWPQVSSTSRADHNPSTNRQSSQTWASYQYSQTTDCSLSSQSSSCWESSLQSQTSQTVTYYQCLPTYSHRRCSEPPPSPPSQTVLFSQQEVPEIEASLCHRDKHDLSFQILNGRSEDQATTCRQTARRERPFFILEKFPDTEGPDVKLAPSTEQPNPAVVSHLVSSCPEETDYISGAQKDEKTTWTTSRSKPEDTLASGGQLRWKQHLSNQDGETTDGAEDGGELYQQSESEVVKTKRFGAFPTGLWPNDYTRTEIAERKHRKGPLVQSEPINFVLGDNSTHNLERIVLMEETVEAETENKTKMGTDESVEHKVETFQLHFSDIQPRQRQCETNYKEEREARKQRAERKVPVVPLLDYEEKIKPAEVSDGERYLIPASSQRCGKRRSGFRAPCILGNQLHHANVRRTNRSSRETKSSMMLIPASTIAAGQDSSAQDFSSAAATPNKKLETRNLASRQSQLHHPHLTPNFLRKRKHDVLQHQHANPPPKINQTRYPTWESAYPAEEKSVMSKLKTAMLNSSFLDKPAISQESLTSIHPHESENQQIWQNKVEKQYNETVKDPSKQIPESKPCKCMSDKCSTDPATNGPEGFQRAITDLQAQSKGVWLPGALTSDTRVKDSGNLSQEERMQMLEKAGEVKVLVLTMVYRDGTTQLDPEKKLTPPVCGLFVLMKGDPLCSTPEDSLGPNDSLIYLKLEHTPPWVQQQTHHTQELFTRDMFLRILSRSQLLVCYKAKDLLCTALQLNIQELSWKQAAGCQIQDPQVSGWLLDPADPSSCFDELLNKHCKRPRTAPAPGAEKVSQIISGLNWLYKLNMNLCSKLQSQGLWRLYSDMELNMIPVLAAMESHRIHVDKEALKGMSDLLGTKMKQLEQEAHQAAGQIFLVTSNTQLRAVLFEKLRLHERCENKKLPKTFNKQQQSTSEAALLQLQDLHPLPKIILEYRQIHKIKSTFVDGILSCMRSKNFQALPRQPLHIRKKQYIQGMEEEVVTVHPRAMFVPQEGWTFLAADFCQVELRLLAHLSSDPELLRIFTNPQADVFTMLASRWKRMNVGEVTSEDREQSKRIVYAIVYGVGRERLSGILGVSADQASQFQDTFLQTYIEVHAFIQRTIQQSHKQGYVLSIMGRRRNLPNINSPDWGVRTQAERQAVNFVVQGSAADLCKMAMIRIFNLVSSSSSLSARLLAQLHDELLFEVEDSQVEQFAVLVRSTMESLQHMDHLGVHLKVPLKVAVSSGKSWGSMSELNIPALSFP
ncbi:DNA polymerase nu isoform X3 [Melanotaenia boesemani]|uniref:DNA polymerase nu isoform X3 n=1 Tax=Melanotaenia boesemani TaxID=1250792 RepID=UPI001C056FD9|nr:DNA polymerase nu isoform X3 [Melanotaenia boesemani]